MIEQMYQHKLSFIMYQHKLSFIDRDRPAFFYCKEQDMLVTKQGFVYQVTINTS